MFKVQLFILLLIFVQKSSCVIDSLFETGKDLWTLHSMINNIKLNATSDLRAVDQLLSSPYEKRHEVRRQVDEIYRKLEEMEKSMHPKVIRNFFKSPSNDVQMYRCMETIELLISHIDEYYRKFHEVMIKNSYYANYELQDLMRKITVTVMPQMELIRKILTNAKEYLKYSKNLVTSITEYALKNFSKLCDSPQIVSGVLVHLFRMAVIAEIKATVMLAFINIHRYTLNEEWKAVNSLMMEQFEKHFRSYVNVFALSIDLTDGLYFRACDPPDGNWIRDKSFHELEGTFQATVFRHHWAQCKYNSCNDVWFNKAYQCGPKFYNYRTSCSSGIMTECAYLSAVHMCVLENGPYKFQFVNSSAIGSLGRNFQCPKKGAYMIEDGMGWQYNFATCACNCYSSHNKISLVLMRSRVRANMVITGLRFLRSDDILYIQPREGKLSGNGYIRPGSERWVFISNDLLSSEIHSIDRNNRVFFLDDLHLPQNYILTGIKFNKVKRGTVPGFAIEIFGTLFDYGSGQLMAGDHFQISRRAPDGNPGRSLPFTPVSPVFTKLPHTPNGASIKYVSLERSTLRDDFGQSTLPLFDAIPIYTENSPLALGGVGIFHKGVKGYAGFISLRVYGLNYARYFFDFESDYMTYRGMLFDQW